MAASRAGRHSKLPATIRPGTRVGRYTVGARLHEGGTANIFAVGSARTRPPLVLKTPKLGPDHPLSSLMTFENEKQVLARLRGPHVPRLIASRDLREQPYLIMERIEGDALAQAAKRAPIAIDALCKLGVRLCRAVQALHHQNVIHLDLNPSNVRNRANGEMVLIDYGLAHHAQLPDLHDAAFGEEEGTTPYISPEQLHHVRSDSRSDIYAIGAILYQLATGHYPFGRPNLLSLAKRLAMPPLPPRCHRPELPAWLQEIILRCLEIRPERRFATAKEIAHLLAHPEVVHVGKRGHRTSPPGWLQRLRGWQRSVFQKFDEYPAPRPYELLTTSPHVLVALDLGHCSEALGEALRRAVRRLARSEPRSYFTCLSVLPAKESAPCGATTAPDMMRQVAMRNWAQPLKLASPRLVFQVLPGDPARAIVEYAHQHQVDFIVIGARASSALRQHLGSVSATVAAQAPCSVTVVRTRRDIKR
jgi:serine/threonine protein kinase